MSRVVLIRCESYEYSEVLVAVQRGLSLLGGVGLFVQPGEKILMKPNLVTGAAPERSITTHPAVFRAACAVFLEAGARISYGDSPGILSFRNAARAARIEAVARDLKLAPADFTHSREVVAPAARKNKVFHLFNAVFEADGIVSLPKFKTHSLTCISASMKNQFGCIPYFQKRVLHAKFPAASDFSQMLADLNTVVRPRLFIMDGIVAMEGDGPVAGNPKKMNVLGFSADPVALDACMCRLIDLDPERVDTIVAGQQCGLGEYAMELTDLEGDSPDEMKCADFRVDRGRKAVVAEGSVTGRILLSFLKKPVILPERCIACGDCEKVCPPETAAIFQLPGSAPTIDYDKCIRCYCCHEFCLHHAIELK